MNELSNEEMKEYLRRGLLKVYSESIVLEDGTVRTLIAGEVVDGRTYQVQLIRDERFNDTPYVQVLMKENEEYFSNWEFFLTRTIDESLVSTME